MKKTEEQIEAHRRLCEHFDDTLLGDGRTCCTADLRALPTWQDPCGDGTVYPCENECPYMKQFIMKIAMETLKPIIQTEEPDKYGRTVKVGIQEGSYSTFLQAMSIEEVEHLRDELIKFLSGAKQPGCFYIPEVSLNEMREQVKVGDTVQVRFEEFGMPDKHVPGRVVHPKRVYKLVSVTEKKGSHLKGRTYNGWEEVKFHVEQIIQVYESK